MRVKSNVSGTCPFCGESNLEYEAVRFDGDICYYPWKCINCNHEGEEYYSLEFIGHNVYDEEGSLIEIENSMIIEEK